MWFDVGWAKERFLRRAHQIALIGGHVAKSAPLPTLLLKSVQRLFLFNNIHTHITKHLMHAFMHGIC